MPFRPLLLLSITLIKNDKLDYLSVFTFGVFLLLAVLGGIWLWLIGLDLARGGRRVSGALVLAAATAYSIAVVGLVYWQMTQLLDLL